MQDKIWVTKTGQQLLVAQMTTSHIVNCIRLIEKSGRRWRKEYLERLRMELYIRELGLR